jgi:hypothetical protein
MPAPRIHLRAVQFLVLAAAILCVVALRAGWFIADGWHLVFGSLAFEAFVATYRPAWFGRLVGHHVYDGPFWPFRRWTWMTPPQDWAKLLRNNLVFSLLVCPAVAVWFYVRRPDHPQWGFIAFFALLGLKLVAMSIRIWTRVRAVRADPVVERRIG